MNPFEEASLVSEPYNWDMFIDPYTMSIRKVEPGSPSNYTQELLYFSDTAYHGHQTAHHVRSQYRFVERPEVVVDKILGFEWVLQPGSIVPRDVVAMVRLAKQRKAGSKAVAEREGDHPTYSATSPAFASEEFGWGPYLGLRPVVTNALDGRIAKYRSAGELKKEQHLRATGQQTSVELPPGTRGWYMKRHGRTTNGKRIPRLAYGRLVFWLRHPTANPFLPASYSPSQMLSDDSVLPVPMPREVSAWGQNLDGFESYISGVQTNTVAALWAPENTTLEVSRYALELEKNAHTTMFRYALRPGARHYDNYFAETLSSIPHQVVDGRITGMNTMGVDKTSAVLE